MIYQTIDLEVYSAPNEKGLVHCIGTEKAKDVFDRLLAHLKSRNMVPEEYFNFGDREFKEDAYLPKRPYMLCMVRWGGNEGIYLDIDCIGQDDRENRISKHFAVGKTLGETAEDFFFMHKIAAECDIMLNSGGWKMKRNAVSLEMTPGEIKTLQSVVCKELSVPGLFVPEHIKALESARDTLQKAIQVDDAQQDEH